MSNLIDPLHLPPGDSPKPGPALTPQPKPAPAPRRPSGWLIVQRHVTPERLMIVMLILLVVFLAQRGGHGPVPGPKPEPRPAPVAGKLYVTIVQDTEHKTQEAAQIEADPALSEGLNKLGAKFLNVDTHVAWIDSQHLRPQIDKAGGPPVLIIQAVDTKRIVAEKLPNSVAEILDAVRKFKGGDR